MSASQVARELPRKTHRKVLSSEEFRPSMIQDQGAPYELIRR